MFNIRKRVAVFTLLIICNFFIAPIIEVSAEESNINYLSKISEEENIIENNLLSLKNDTYYENDSYKYAIDKINRDFSNLKVDYNSYKNSALNNISIEDVLIDNNISLDNINLDNYAYLNLNNLKDITYYDEEKEENVTVLTKDTLESYVTKYYFNDYYNRYEEFSNNYLTNISNYQSFYNNVKNNYDNSITKINKIKEEINTFNIYRKSKKSWK